jgi:aminopeptidase
MADPRVEAYARLLVERSIDVQPGMQVLIRTTPLARPLLEEVSRGIARRQGFPLIRIAFDFWPTDLAWAVEAPLELVEQMPDIDGYALANMDARITIDAPENTREDSDLAPERAAALSKRTQPYMHRIMNEEIPWVSCQYPTNALAQEAGMSFSAFEDFLYGACLLDWDREAEQMRRLAARFDPAEEVRIVAAGTDLRLSIAGREADVDDGRANVPGGEFAFAPVEDSAEGTIEFGEFPAIWRGRELTGVRFRFEGGRVVDASAQTGEEILVSTLDTDEGARRIGELGIGCNPGITRYMKNTLFDEKIDGTIHLALGASYEFMGGKNKSAIHWDLVKDLRDGGQLLVDGELVQENGRWLI